MALVPACGSNCIDDGFEWSQSKEECIGTATETTGDTETTNGSTTGPTGPTTTGPTTSSETEGLVQVCKDADMDGQGDPENCMPGDGDNPPPGYVPNGDDCKDDDPNTYKGAAEIEFPELCATDADDDGWAEPDPGDGIMGGTDCVDSNADVFPGSAENEDLSLCTEDKDGDGWGDVEPVPGADAGSDCDDDDSAAYPGAASMDSPDACTKDSDGDGYGDPNPPPGGEAGTDCDDEDASTFPGSAPNEVDPLGCYTDADDDDWGDDMPKDGVDVGSDCDDSSTETFPGAAENEVDNVACMRDEDKDGYGDEEPPEGVTSGTDCNDENVDVFENCADCTPDEFFCDADNSMLCNSRGDGSELQEFCDFGCDPENGKCIVMLSVDAGPSICIDQGATVQLEAMAAGGDGAYMWDWTPADSLSDAKISNPEATPPEATTYTVTVTDGQNAMASDNVSVFIKDASLVLDDLSCKITNFKWGGTPKVNWDWNPDEVELCQLSNSTPTARFCGWTLDNANIQGHFQVKTTADDDWVGVLFGIQPFDQMTMEPEQFYFMGWKQGNQVGTFCKAYEDVGREGIIVKRIDVKNADQDPLDCGDFHAPSDTPNSVLLADEAAFSEVGWKDNVAYIIDLTHTPDNFTIKVIEEETMVVVAEKTFEDNTYPNGQVGFYSNSQEKACFYDFKTSCL